LQNTKLDGWIRDKLSSFFQDKKTETEVSIKWFYPSYDESESMLGKKEIGLFKAAEETSFLTCMQLEAC